MRAFERDIFKITEFNLLCARCRPNRLLIVAIQTIFTNDG